MYCLKPACLAAVFLKDSGAESEVEFLSGTFRQGKSILDLFLQILVGGVKP